MYDPITGEYRVNNGLALEIAVKTDSARPTIRPRSLPPRLLLNGAFRSFEIAAQSAA